MEFKYIDKKVKKMMKPQFFKIYKESERYKQKLYREGHPLNVLDEQQEQYLNLLMTKIMDIVTTRVINEEECEDDFKEKFSKEAIYLMESWKDEFEAKLSGAKRFSLKRIFSIFIK